MKFTFETQFYGGLIETDGPEIIVPARSQKEAVEKINRYLPEYKEYGFRIVKIEFDKDDV